MARTTSAPKIISNTSIVNSILKLGVFFKGDFVIITIRKK